MRSNTNISKTKITCFTSQIHLDELTSIYKVSVNEENLNVKQIVICTSPWLKVKKINQKIQIIRAKKNNHTSLNFPKFNQVTISPFSHLIWSYKSTGFAVGSSFTLDIGFFGDPL